MPDLERVKQLTPLTLSNQWSNAVGVAVDPGTVTIGIRRADGTVLVAAGTATTGSGTAARSFNLTTTHTAVLDRLTVTWTTTLQGVDTSYVEVVGGFLFRLGDLSAEVSDSTSSYTEAQMGDARTYAETQLESACGRAFVPRYTTETFNGDCSRTLALRWPNILAVRSVMVDGIAYTVDQLAGLAFSASGIITNTLGTWSLGASNITVSYEHGDPFLDPGASEAALVLAKHKLVRGPIDERATQRTSEFGPVNLATPGMFGSRFGIPVVDAFVQANNMNVGVA